ncbi:MAG: methylglyoxal synthase [Firmicutes bacterium HGW-Firmicutes-20]|nr:MAG: methylglyoxal synthase [Firmicutes bacterium HGW-Firmicutes-20]PKM90695.1 MAG: methylglyoxal synthase [Firmicutes bacterium HGW-Firmicutes-10]
MKKNLNIALIAHDNRKDDLVKWVLTHKAELSIHNLCGTGTTSKRVADASGLQVKGYMSGPLGGDQQIGAAIAQKEIDMLIFFWDPLTSQPHDPDVKALLRIAVLYDIPTASNPSTADLMLIALANKDR